MPNDAEESAHGPQRGTEQPEPERAEENETVPDIVGGPVDGDAGRERARDVGEEDDGEQSEHGEKSGTVTYR